MYSLLILAFIFILLLGGREYYSIFYAVSLIILCSFLYCRYIKRGVSAIIFSDRNEISRNERVRYEILLQNNTILPIFDTRLIVKSLAVDYRVNYIAPLRQLRIRGDKAFEKRGRYILGPMEISGREPFGLFGWDAELPPKLNITVFPRVYQTDFIQYFLRDENGAGALSIRQNSNGPYDVRKYIYGDNFKKMHWKLSAKYDELMVREYKDSERAGIRILLDMRGKAYDDRGEEEALSLLLSCAASFLQHNMMAEVLLLNREISRVMIKDKSEFEKLLYSLVDMKFEGTMEDDFLHHLLFSEEFQPGLIITSGMSESLYGIMDDSDCRVLTVMENVPRQDERIITPAIWRDIFDKSDSQVDIYVCD